VSLHIFSFVPVRQRLLLNAVCRGWRAAVAEPSLWRVADLTPSYRYSFALIDAVLRSSRGQLRLLDLSTSYPSIAQILGFVRRAPLLATLKLATDSASKIKVADVDALLAAAPRLELLACSVRGSPEQMLSLLKRTPPYAALCVIDALVDAREVEVDSDDEEEVEVDAWAIAEAVASHEGLLTLTITDLPLTTAQLEAFVTAGVARQLTRLRFIFCGLTPAHLPQLTLALTVLPLVTFSVTNADTGLPVVRGLAVPAFCTALRASRLTYLELAGMALWSHSLADGLAVLDALTGHPTVMTAVLSVNAFSDVIASAVAVGDALGRMVAAQPAHLTALDLSHCWLTDEAATPLFEAVAGSNKLHELDCTFNEIIRECARDVILPAVEQNNSLWALKFDRPFIDELVEAEDLVADR
jgi:hypothetical protein